MSRALARWRRAPAGLPAALATGLLAALLVAGCSGDDSPEPGPASSKADAPASGSPSATEEPAGDAWNPCDALAVDRVARALGTEVTEDRGTPETPRCALLPAEEGGPVLDANYMVFPDGLDAAWDSMGAPQDGSVTEPAVRGADAARLVVQAGDDGVTATGFVQNGPLIHVVNAADTSPYDRDALLRGVRLVMTQLSAHADQAGELAGAG